MSQGPGTTGSATLDAIEHARSVARRLRPRLNATADMTAEVAAEYKRETAPVFRQAGIDEDEGALINCDIWFSIYRKAHDVE